jgi:sugar phosphate isomerase/epimerase
MLIGAATLGYLYSATLPEALRSICAAGYEAVELSVTPPHFHGGRASDLERRGLARLFRRERVVCATINPIDINLISPYSEIADFGVQQVIGALEIGHELGATCVVFSPGQRHRLIPSPVEDALVAVARQLERLLPIAERLGVTLAVETVPFGLLQTGREALAAIAPFDSPWLGVGYDAANTLASEPESPARGLLDVGAALKVVHVSGSWRDRWAHESVRVGDIDYDGFAAAIRSSGFAGPTIYELADGADPGPRLRHDADLLRTLGFTTNASAVA